MNRRILFIIIIIIAGVLYLQGMHFTKNDNSNDFTTNDNIYTTWIENIVDSLNIPDPAVKLALNGYNDLKSQGLIKNDSLLSLIDFSKASKEKRMFIFDLKNEKIIKYTYVAHGMQSGVQMAESFSNKRFSNKSSLGLYLTKETYEGKHGYSLRIDGLSAGLNDNVRKRAVVIHGANYVSESFIKRNGRLGRSFGCPALPVDETQEIIDLIKGGTCMYIYHQSLIPISQAALEKLP